MNSSLKINIYLLFLVKEKGLDVEHLSRFIQLIDADVLLLLKIDGTYKCLKVLLQCLYLQFDIFVKTINK